MKYAILIILLEICLFYLAQAIFTHSNGLLWCYCVGYGGFLLLGVAAAWKPLAAMDAAKIRV